MLDIRDLGAAAGGRQILNGINLTVNAGEVHAIMGPNGSGKSTLAGVLAGRDGLEVTGGSATFKGQDLLDLEPEERAREGLFLAFQYPVEIPGVNNAYLLKAALNEVRKHRGQPELDAMDFMTLIRERMKLLRMDDSLLNRPVNEGFSAVRRSATRSSSWRYSSVAGDSRRDRLRTGHRRPADRGRRRERVAERRAVHGGRHPLPASAELHRA